MSNQLSMFFRAVFGKNRDTYQAVSNAVAAAYERQQKAVDHLNKAIDAHNRVEHRREMLRIREMRENRAMTHGARHYRGPGL